MKNVTYINAGAGSGRTHHTIALLTNLVADGKVRPDQVIMTTPSNQAADELKVRIRQSLVDRGLSDASLAVEHAPIGTLHSIAITLMRKCWYLLGIVPDVQVTDPTSPGSTTPDLYDLQSLANLPTAQERDFLADFAHEFNVDSVDPLSHERMSPNPNFWIQPLQDVISLSASCGVTDYSVSRDRTLQLASSVLGPTAADAADLAKVNHYITLLFNLADRWQSKSAELMARKRVLSHVDVERLLLQLLQNPTASADVADAFKYVFVSEFQDCTPIQVKIFDLLSDLMTHSFWLGDVKQAICTPDAHLTKAIMDRMASGADGCSLENLDTSWRSIPPIVSVCNNFFSRVYRGVLPASMVKLEPRRELPANAEPCLRYWNLTDCDRPAQCFKQIAAQVACVVAKGADPDCIAIIARSHAQLRGIADALAPTGIPVSMEEHYDVRNLAATDLLLAILSLVLDTDNELAKATLEHFTIPGVTIDHVANSILSKGEDEPTKYRSLFKSYAISLTEKISEFQHRYLSMPIGALVETVILEFGLLDFVKNLRMPHAQTACLEALIWAARKYDACASQGSRPSIPGFIAYVRETDIKCCGRADGIHLVTYGNARGRQWKHVILTALGQDSFPQSRVSDVPSVHWEYVSQPSASDVYPEACISVRISPSLFSDKENVPSNSIANSVAKSDVCPSVAERTRLQAANLLYVGMTCAQDSLTLVLDGLDWFNGIAPGSAEIRPDGNILGTGDVFTDCSLPKAQADAPLPVVVKQGPPLILPPPNFKSRDYRPNRDVELDDVSGCGRVLESGIIGERIELHAEDDKKMECVSNCIHHIFALAEQRPEAPGFENLARRLVADYDLADALPKPGQICAAWQNLVVSLTEAYGPAKEIMHERPFSVNINEFRVTGSMDMVWVTDSGCVIIGLLADSLEPDVVLNARNCEVNVGLNDRRYAGFFAGQLDACAKALEAVGETVIANYVFYPVTGLLAKLGHTEVPLLYGQYFDYYGDEASLFIDKMKRTVFTVYFPGLDVRSVVSYAANVIDEDIEIFEVNYGLGGGDDEDDDDDDDDNRDFSDLSGEIDVIAAVRGKSAEGVGLKMDDGGPLDITLPLFGSEADVSVAYGLLVAVQNLCPSARLSRNDGKRVGVIGEEFRSWLFDVYIGNILKLMDFDYVPLVGIERMYCLNSGFLKSQHPEARTPKQLAMAALSEFAAMQWCYVKYPLADHGGNGWFNGEYIIQLIQRAGSVRWAYFSGPLRTYSILRNAPRGTTLVNSDFIVLMFHGMPIFVRNADFFACAANLPFVHMLDARQAEIDYMPADDWESLCFAAARKANAHPGVGLLLYDDEEEEEEEEPIAESVSAHYAQGRDAFFWWPKSFYNLNFADTVFLVDVRPNGGARLKADVINKPYVNLNNMCPELEVWVRDVNPDGSAVIPIAKLREALPGVEWGSKDKFVRLDDESALKMRELWSEWWNG